MSIHVNIGEAKTRLSELVAAAVRGEDVVLDKAGDPQVRLVPVAARVASEAERIAMKRKSAIGMFGRQADGLDLGLDGLKADRVATDDRSARHLAPSS
jgi:prevent-host-death family protein